jgi:hypothetical protein
MCLKAGITTQKPRRKNVSSEKTAQGYWSAPAGREGINLQFARILFNHDLPWNPMDLEQRIGRIHRYGQDSTAQVYNLVSGDTIEGRIYLLMEDKLSEIAAALGKVDENGQIAEDPRTQVLGQLGNSISYDRLYQDALRDPKMRRTRQELEIAVSNASLARKVVFELFQDLERFDLGDYKKFDDPGRGMERLVNFLAAVSHIHGWTFKQESGAIYTLQRPGENTVLFTSDRDTAIQNEQIQLIGLEHPLIKQIIESFTQNGLVKSPALAGSAADIPGGGILSFWNVCITARDGIQGRIVTRIGIDANGSRSPRIEAAGDYLSTVLVAPLPAQLDALKSLAMENKNRIQELLHRDLVYRGLLSEDASYSAEPLALIFFCN